ncbi:hypothetical protein ScPMuIL_007295, partial [Solemya velum]
KKINPTGKDGQILTCRSCGSFRHLVSNCPDSWERLSKVNITEDEHVVLFTGDIKEDITRLGADAYNCAVLDSACSSTVCGANWMKNYISSLGDSDVGKVTCSEGQRIFKFGGGTRLKSKYEYLIPAYIAGKNITIKTDVVDSDIPLLLSRSAMKKAETVCAVKLDEMDEKKRHATLLKLHKQFAHPPTNRLIALLKDACVWKDEYLEMLSKIGEDCNMCKVYARSPPRPVVSMPMASRFNEKVAMDLKQWKGRWILHMIDMWSRYTVSVFICRKKSSDVIDVVMRHWIGVFGVMGQSLLCWANMARNSLHMWNGFSSHQLVFGESPNLPGIMTDTLPAIDGSTSSETFARHMNYLHASRKAYIETEANERIRRALRSKIRSSDQTFNNGDQVYYKREGREKWLGPGKVVFQDGKVIFVRHGGVFVRVSPNRLVKVKDSRGVDLEDKVHEQSENLMKSVANDQQKGSTCETEDNTTTKPTLHQVQSPEIESKKTYSLKPRDKIRYQMANSDQWINATIIGRAGKATGKYRDWFNVKDEVTNEQKSVDLSVLTWENFQENQPEEEVTNIVEHDDSKKAKELELEKLQNFNTYEEIENEGQKTLSTRWVITSKDDKVKARLVVRGLRRTSYKKWTVKTTDIKSAFLQGKEIDREIYLKPPKESSTSENMIWKLRHCLYGLRDGARQFFISVKEELLKLDFCQCDLDPAVFYIHKSGILCGIICCHVDDFLHAGDEHFEKLMIKLRERFSAGKVADSHFRYIGFTVRQDDSGITLDQSEFMEKVKTGTVDPSRATKKHEVLDDKEQTLYRQLIGQLNWAVQGCRPDMAFEMINLSTKLKLGTVSDLIHAIKVVGRLRDIKSRLFFPSLSQKLECKIL